MGRRLRCGHNHKYFWVVAAMIFVQILLGVVTAHYGVEGDGFYGIPLSKWLPYGVTRTWHMQLGIFWIATAWLAAGLFIGPPVSGEEPKGQTPRRQRAVRRPAGGRRRLDGRPVVERPAACSATLVLVRPPGLRVRRSGPRLADRPVRGLLLWLAWCARALPGVEPRPRADSPAVLFVMATTAIALFYGAGLTWGQHTHLSMVEYWRWWVVHLWVEGFFEVFATAVIAFLFTRLGLVRSSTATTAVLLSTIVSSPAASSAPAITCTSRVRRRGAGVGCGVQRAGSGAAGLIGFEACENFRLSARQTMGAHTAGRSTSSSPWPSGTWWAPACSAS